MKIIIDYETQAIDSIENADLYEGDINSNSFVVLFKNVDEGFIQDESTINFYPTLTQLAPNGREAGAFLPDALGTGETIVYTEDDVSYLRYTFTMNNNYALIKGRSNFFIYVNKTINGGLAKKVYGKFTCVLNESDNEYFVSDPAFNPVVKQYIDEYSQLRFQGIYSTNTAIQALTENQGIVLNITTGYWWYWDDSQEEYVQGNVFQATEVSNASITWAKLAASLKAIIDNKIINGTNSSDVYITTDDGISLTSNYGINLTVDDGDIEFLVKSASTNLGKITILNTGFIKFETVDDFRVEADDVVEIDGATSATLKSSDNNASIVIDSDGLVETFGGTGRTELTDSTYEVRLNDYVLFLGNSTGFKIAPTGSGSDFLTVSDNKFLAYNQYGVVNMASQSAIFMGFASGGAVFGASYGGNSPVMICDTDDNKITFDAANVNINGDTVGLYNDDIANIRLNINTSNYTMAITLTNNAGNTLTSNTVDLPLESVVVNGRYDSVTKKIILTLVNGNTIEISVGDLVSGLQSEITLANKLSSDLVTDIGNIHKFVTQAEKEQITTNANNISSHATAIQNNGNNITSLSNAIGAIKDGTTLDSFADVETSIAALENSKQDNLSAGTGIDITSNTVSVDTSVIQEVMSGSSSIDITSNTISVKESYIDSQFLTDAEMTTLLGEVF